MYDVLNCAHDEMKLKQNSSERVLKLFRFSFISLCGQFYSFATALHCKANRPLVSCSASTNISQHCSLQVDAAPPVTLARILFSRTVCQNCQLQTRFEMTGLDDIWNILPRNFGKNLSGAS